MDERELIKLTFLAIPICISFHLPFGLVYPLILGHPTVDPFSERVVVSLISCLGFLLPWFKGTRSWIQAFLYFICFLYSGHLFSLVCRNDLNVFYQLGYVCVLAVVAFYLDTNLIYGIYVIFNFLFLGISLFYKVSYETLFFGMIISTILSIEWIALLSRIRALKALEASRAEVMEKNRKIQSILENIQQGVLTIETSDGRIGAECSTYLYQLMMCRPEEIHHLKDILEHTELSKDQIEQILAAVTCIIHEGEFAFAANCHIFPRTLIEHLGTTTRHFELDWNPVYDHQGLVVNLLVCIRDVTELQQLKKDAAHGQLELQLLGELVGIPHERRLSVLDASDDLMANAEKSEPTAVPSILRMIHTLKGNARAFGLLTLAEGAHECENALLEARAIDSRIFAGLHELLASYRTIATEKLGHKMERDEILPLPRQRIKAAVSMLEKAGFDGLSEAQRQAFKQIYEVLHGSLYVRLQQILDVHLRSLPQLANALGKAAPVVHIVDPGVELKQESRDLLGYVFSHLLRNALDHGLEGSSERLQAGKSAEGHIWLVMKPRPQGLEIHFHDDGRGLNLEAIQRKAIDQGLIAAGTRMSPDAIAELIFHSGFSTKASVSEISGRGVGLDAVRHMLEEAGGHIRLVLDQPRPGGCVSGIFVLQLHFLSVVQPAKSSA